MEHSASDPVTSSTSPERVADTGTGADLAAELAATRDRLAFYESFDALIQDNVRRSGELLRQVAAEREAVERRLSAMRTEVDQRLAEQRTVLETIASGLADLESNLGSVTSQVNESLARLSGASAPATPDFEPPGRVDGTPTATEESDRSLPTGATAALEFGPTIDFPVSPFDRDPVAALPAPSSEREADRAAMPKLADVKPDAETAGDAVPAPRTIDLVIHGVPKAATALAIQRHLQDLAGVDAVEVREYVSGVLRFQVVATNFGPEDVRRWEGGGSLQTLTVQPHVLEVRLPNAEGC